MENFSLYLEGVWGFFFTFFFLFERERESTYAQAGEGQREEETESQTDSALSAQKPDAGLKLMNHEIMTWAETKSQRLNRLHYPGTPMYKEF